MTLSRRKSWRWRLLRRAESSNLALVLVYGLYDPIDGELRYVGKTTQALHLRLKSHVQPSSLKGRSYRASWIKSLLARGVAPLICSIQKIGCISELGPAERYWIAFFRAAGARLVNGTDGGEGPGFQSEATKKKISGTLKTRVVSQEARANLSKALLGHRLSAETKEKISAARKGSVLSAETRAKMSAAHKGRTLAPEHIAKVAAFHLGRKRSPETCARISAAARQRAALKKVNQS